MTRARVSWFSSFRHGLSGILPPPGIQRGYALATLIDSVGTGAFLAGSAVFFVRIVGLSAAQVGIGMSLAGLVGLAFAVPLGHLGDRLGHRRLLLILSLIRAPLFAVYLLIHDFAAFLAVVSVIAAAETGTNPVRRAYLSTMVPPDQRVRITAYNRATFNVGISLGSLGAAAALGFDTWSAYATLVLANSASFLLCCVVLLRLPADPGRRAVTRPASRKGADKKQNRSSVFRDRPYIALSLLFGLQNIHAALFTVGIPLWIVKHTVAPKWLVATIILLNTILVVALQVHATRGTESVPGAARGARRAGLAMLAGCVACAVSAHGPVGLEVAELVGGAVLLTFGELLSSASAWALSNELAPEDKQGIYFGLWTQGSQFAQVVGPVTVTVLAVGLRLTGWLILGASFGLIGVAIVPVTRWAQRSRPAPEGAVVATSGRQAG